MISPAVLALIAGLSSDPGAHYAPVEAGMFAFPWVETMAERGGSPARSYSRMKFHRVTHRPDRDTGIPTYWIARLERTRFDRENPAVAIVEVFWIDQRRCPQLTEALDIVLTERPFTAYAPEDITDTGAALSPHGAHWTISRYGQSGGSEIMMTQTDRTGRVLGEPLMQAERVMEPCLAGLTPIRPG